MAVNPITSDNLTIDFKSLMSIPVGDRSQAASSSSSFLQSILAALTPIQIAKAFPDYFRRNLPDISNFLAATRYFDSGGIAHQTGGGDLGYTPAGGYDGENKPSGSARPAGMPEPTIDEMKKKLLEKGIDVDGIYNTVGQNGVSEADPSMEVVKGMSNEALSEAGLQRITKPDGSTIIMQKLSEVAAMTDEQVAETMRSGAGKDSDYIYDQKSNREKASVSRVQVQAQLIREAKEQGIDLPPERAKMIAASIAGQANRESNYNPKAVHDERTGLGMYGHRDDPRGRADDPNSRRRTFALKWMEENQLDRNSMEAWNRYSAHEIMTLPRFKGLKKELLEGDITLEQATQRVADIFEAPAAPERAPGSDSMRVRQEGAKFALEEPKLSPEATIAGENERFTPEQIAKARISLVEEEKQKRQDALTRRIFNQASPTSSDYIPDPNDPRTATMIPIGGTMSGKSILSGEDVPYSGGSKGSRSFGGPRGTNQLHTGVDIPGTPGDPVLAVDEGTIVGMRKSPSGYGYIMDVQYPDGTVHRMAHLGTNDGGWESAFGKDLKIGDKVAPGQQIGTMGYSGNAGPEFPHVHYEIIRQDYYEETKGSPPGRISGRTDASMNELERGRIDPREWYKKRQEDREKAAAEAEKKAIAPPAAASIAEQQMQKSISEASVEEDHQESKTDVPSPPPEQKVDATLPPPEPTATPVPQLAQGGNLYGLNEDLSLVDNVTGEPVAQVGKNEKLVKQGTTMQVTSTDRLKAEELTQKYDTGDMETRLNIIEDGVDQVRDQQTQKRDAPAPASIKNEPINPMWREAAIAHQYDESPSHRRAMNRVRGRPESGAGQFDHFTKATISSKV